jgi:tetratricopeptide (TPR) repeat protein
MDEQRTFVGRQAELNRFREILEDPRGQAIVVVGQAGMGKTWLLDRMTYLATHHPSLKCGWVRYEVTLTDSPDSTMALMMDHAFEAAQIHEGSFDKSDRSRKQWAALFKTFIPKGGDILELLASLRPDPQKHTREQFIDRLHLISKRMNPDGRALFVIDPEKLMCPGCADSWRLVTRDLPDKVKFVFAQRPEDELINSSTFMAMGNVIPLPTERLGVLAAEEVEDLIRLRAEEVGQPGRTLQEAMNRYQGHPYAIQAAMEIVKKTKRVEDLPQDPTNDGIAATQWRQVCRSAEAIRLFEAYAILEVAIPRDIVQTVSGLDAPTMKRLLGDSYLCGLLREEGQGRRIYHAILADHVRGQIDQGQQKALHSQAILLYRARLKETREQNKAPDALAAVRLPEHVLAAEGPDAFVRAFVGECTVPLISLGLLDAAMALSQRARGFVRDDTEEKAAVLGNLGILFETRGDLDEAERMFTESLEIDQEFGHLKGIAIAYANFGAINFTRGKFDEAENMHSKALQIQKELGNLEGMAKQYASLGVIQQTRGHLDQAESLHAIALQIHQRIGRLDGVASNYADLGVIHLTRGNLDEAEKMFEKALQSHKTLGRLEGMASQYGNLGLVHQRRGDLDKAEKMHLKALHIEESLGRLKGMASQYGNLGALYQTRGDFDKAQKMLSKTVEIEQKLGRLEGIATAYGNLALICGKRGNLDEAEGMLCKALEINQRLGRLEGIANAYANLSLICETRGDFAEARRYCERALALFQKVGARDKMETVQTWIDHLPMDGQ